MSSTFCKLNGKDTRKISSAYPKKNYRGVLHNEKRIALVVKNCGIAPHLQTVTDMLSTICNALAFFILSVGRNITTDKIGDIMRKQHVPLKVLLLYHIFSLLSSSFSKFLQKIFFKWLLRFLQLPLSFAVRRNFFAKKTTSLACYAVLVTLFPKSKIFSVIVNRFGSILPTNLAIFFEKRLKSNSFVNFKKVYATNTPPSRRLSIGYALPIFKTLVLWAFFRTIFLDLNILSTFRISSRHGFILVLKSKATHERLLTDCKTIEKN